MKRILIGVFLLSAISCGDGNDANNGIGQIGITPIDNRSETTLYGTYKVVSVDNETGVRFTGDNVTGELTISSSEIRYRAEYINGNHSYYSFNILDTQTDIDYSAIIRRIRNGLNGSSIKNENEIQLSVFGLVKISDTPKDLKSDHDYSVPYRNNNFTPVRVDRTWSITGTYFIEEVAIRRGNNPVAERIHYRDGNIGLISFLDDDNNTKSCDTVYMYKIITPELTSDFPYNGIDCSGSSWQNDRHFEIQLNNGESKFTYTLRKLYDAIGF